MSGWRSGSGSPGLAIEATDWSRGRRALSPRITVVLRIAAHRLPRLRGASADRPYDTLERLVRPDPDGWFHVRITLDWPNEVVSQILEVGPDCELLEPVELREQVAAEARRVAAHDEPARAPLPLPLGV